MLRVIKKLGDLKDGDEFIKIRGEYKFIMRTPLIIYRATNKKETILSSPGHVFAISHLGSIEEMNVEKEVMWLTSLDELNYLADSE